MAKSGRDKEKSTARVVPSRAFSTQYSAGFSTFLFNEFLTQDTRASRGQAHLERMGQQFVLRIGADAVIELAAVFRGQLASVQVLAVVERAHRPQHLAAAPGGGLPLAAGPRSS